jgi:hypothetical protein
MENKFLTAIVITKDGQFLKYRNIINYSHQNNLFYNTKFLTFVKNKNAITINFYDKFTKDFFKQIKLDNENT